MIAVLYIDPRGPYPKMGLNQSDPDPVNWAQRVDCWDATRDARLYAGPHPVVAHPPCKHWGRLKHLAHVQCSNEACEWHGKQPDSPRSLQCPRCRSILVSDADCAPRAVEQVRAFGGVLEHPAGSLLWEACELPVPFRTYADCQGGSISESVDECGDPLLDSFGGYTIELDQVEWGHVARKRTWLYLVGVPREALEAPPFPGREPTHWVSGGRRHDRKGSGGIIPPGIKVCSAQQRRRTPPLFAEYLVRLARAVRR